MRAVLQQALDALETCNKWSFGGAEYQGYSEDRVEDAITAIKQALAHPDEGTHTVRTPAHTDHPLRHYDQTCPACVKGQV